MAERKRLRTLLGRTPAEHAEPAAPDADVATARVELVEHRYGDSVHVAASTFGHLLCVDVRVAAPADTVVQAILFRPNWHRDGTRSRDGDETFFRFLVPMLALRPSFRVTVMVCVGDDGWLDVAEVKGTHALTFPQRPGERSPLLVTGVARGGTTMVMRMLAEHPSLVAVREYPYESRHAQYWVRHLLVGVSPSDRERSMGPQDVNSPSVTSGSNPFFSLGRLHSDWLSTEFVELAAAHAKHAIETFYDHVASSQAKPDAVYFAEKFPGAEQGSALRNLFPGTREVFVVRDLRDVVCSATSMNERRGGAAFGAALAESATEHLANLSKGTLRRWSKYAEDWSADDHLLLRYEDLIADPRAEIARVCRALGVDDAPGTTEQMVAGASDDTGLQDRHVTSRDVASSVGRWRTDLDPEAAAAAPAILEEFDATFGYPVPAR